jgi:hypothetical protein
MFQITCGIVLPTCTCVRDRSLTDWQMTASTAYWRYRDYCRLTTDVFLWLYGAAGYVVVEEVGHAVSVVSIRTVAEMLIRVLMWTKCGHTIRPNSYMDCKSTNPIYCITCKGCNEIHIGQTGNSLCERARVHKQQIHTSSIRTIPLSEHLDTCGGGTFTIFQFYKMRVNSISKRLCKEMHFVNMLKPKLNGH